MDATGSGQGKGARRGRRLFGLPTSREPEPSVYRDEARMLVDLAEAKALMEDAQRIARFGVWQWRFSEDRVVWSPQLYRLFGIDRDWGGGPSGINFMTYLDRVHPEDRDMVREEIENALAEARPFMFEHWIVRPDGEERQVRCQGEPVLDPRTGQVDRIIGVCQDITEFEDLGSPADAHFRIAFEHAPNGIAIVDFAEGPDGRITDVNGTLSSILERPADELIGGTLAALCVVEDFEADEPLRERLVAGEIYGYEIEKRALVGEGRVIWTQMSVSVAPGLSESTGAVVEVQDVTERKRFEEQLRYVADHDSLTGLMNRRRFREELEKHIALRQRYGGKGALLVIDVDRLKAVNDTRGHAAGDIVLRRVAEAMTKRVRSTDVVSRLAGDEFAVLLPSAEPHEAQGIGADLIALVEADEIAAWGASISVGVSPFGDDDQRSSDEVVADADAVMYKAKQQGGAISLLADPERSGEVPHRASPLAEVPQLHAVPSPPRTLAERIWDALSDDQLIIYSQPAVDLRTQDVAHHELLVRMRDEDSGEILAASDFLAAATRSPGLCAAIDRWMTARAIESVRSSAPGARHQINLSGETISSPEHVDALIAQVRDSGIDPASIAFEIAESWVSRDPDSAWEALEALAGAGCPLVLDGFSAEFGSFEFIQRLPVKQIKIDGPVVRRLLADDEDDHATLRAIVRLARGTGKETVAKLVEAADDLPLLKMHGVDLAQGYELGRPAPLEAAA